MKEEPVRLGEEASPQNEELLLSLEARLHQGTDKWQRITAIDLITLSPSEAAITAMIYCLNDPDSDVRFAAVEGLGKLVNPESEAALADACHDSNYFVRKAAEEALRRIRAARA